MNQKEFLDELNKREDRFLLNNNKYYSVVNNSFDTDGGEKKPRRNGFKRYTGSMGNPNDNET